MNRREFSALLPMLCAAQTLELNVEAQSAAPPPGGTHASLPKLESGQYAWGAASHPGTPRVSHPFLTGLLPDNIRLEAHVTFLAPGAPPEKIDHHKHSEMWFMREGTATLMAAGTTRTLKAGDMGLCIAGDDHTISNASATEPASYFVVSVGPPE
jgi:mannose-6-phosphate isomerase-like protein (cupin superfamily)